MPRYLQLDPTPIEPPHEVDDVSLLEQLVEDMTRDGWQCRPLLVEEINRVGPVPIPYQGWTGSHRIEAARQARLSQVPRLVITAEEVQKALLWWTPSRNR